MTSPFPGMDPYLEAHWGDVHQSLIIYARDQLQPGLPGDLRARVQERVFIEYFDHVADDPITENYLQIRELGSGHRVVTGIEFVSLSNKQPGQGKELYLQKQRQFREAGVSSVEIDLLRGGEHVLSMPRDRLPAECWTPYCVCVRRGWEPFKYEVYPMSLRERLPTIAIPLRETDSDVPLDLQTLVDQCYRNGGYDDIDYTADPEPPLSKDDAQWADKLLREKGLRE